MIVSVRTAENAGDAARTDEIAAETAAETAAVPAEDAAVDAEMVPVEDSALEENVPEAAFPDGEGGEPAEGDESAGGQPSDHPAPAGRAHGVGTMLRRNDSRERDSRFAHNLDLIRAAQGGDEQAMERLVTENMGLVRGLANRFRDRGTELEDLWQIGTMGMIKAINSFDCGRGTAFSTYAVPLIVGEIRRHLRDDGLIRVSRGCRHTGMVIMRERARILAEEGREPTVGELSALCHLPREEVAMAMEAMMPVSSLSDNAYGEDSPELGAVIPDHADADERARQMDRIALGQVIAALPPLWRRIVLLRYYRNMTQQQVADRLGLSQVKVSREEKKIMAHMREQLGG